MNIPKEPVLNTLTRLALATSALAAPELACSPKAQVVQDAMDTTVIDIVNALDDKILMYKKNARGIYEKLGEYEAKKGDDYAAAEYFEKAGDKQKAHTYYMKHIKDLEERGLYLRAGHLYKHLDLDQKAEELYRKGTEEAVKKEDWVIAGMGYEFLGDLNKSIECLEKSRRDPSNSMFYYMQLGKSYEKLGNQEMVKSTYMKIAKMCEKRGDEMERWAIYYYRKAGADQKATAILNDIFSVYYDEKGNARDESALVRKAMEIAKGIGDEKLYKEYGYEYAAQLEEEEEHIDAGKVYEKLGQWKSAKRCYEAHLNPSPEEVFPSRDDLDGDEESYDADPNAATAVDEPEEETPTTIVDPGPGVNENDAIAYEGLVRVLKELRKI